MELLEKLLRNDKISASCLSNMSPKHYIKHVNNKQEFENSVSLQQVFKHHIFIVVCFSPLQVYPSLSLFLHLLCYFTFSECFEWLFLCFSRPVWWRFPLFELMFFIYCL